MQSSFLISFIFLFFHQLPSVSAVNDDNICDPSLNCIYCCRDKQCRSEDECKGNFQPFIILGAVAGGLIGLFILRKVWLYYRSKQAKANPRNGKRQGAARSSRWRSKSRSKTPKKEKKSKSSSKSKNTKNMTEKEDLYLQVDNESVVSPDITIKVDRANDDEESAPVKSKGELKVKSGGEIADQEGPTSERKMNQSEMKNSKVENKKENTAMKSSTGGHWTSKKEAPPSKSKDKEKDRKSSGKDGKDKGRSGRSTSTNKDRSGSQKRDASRGKSRNDDMKSSKRSESKK